MTRVLKAVVMLFLTVCSVFDALGVIILAAIAISLLLALF